MVRRRLPPRDAARRATPPSRRCRCTAPSKGGTSRSPRRRPCAARAYRRREFAETPPASTSRGTRSRPAASIAFPTSTSATASWKEAATSSTRAAFPSGEARKVRSAVLRPEKEKSAESRESHARGKWNRAASPSRPARSIATPPGYGSPIIFAALSNASPAASSRVPPRNFISPHPSTRNRDVWPPDTSSATYGKGTSISRKTA